MAGPLKMTFFAAFLMVLKNINLAKVENVDGSNEGGARGAGAVAG